jgi:hypothetical protein
LLPPPSSSLSSHLSVFSIMADSTATPAAAAATGKPVKPDADLFNEQVGKAENEYNEAMARFVSAHSYMSVSVLPPGAVRCMLPNAEILLFFLTSLRSREVANSTCKLDLLTFGSSHV